MRWQNQEIHVCLLHLFAVIIARGDIVVMQSRLSNHMLSSLKTFARLPFCTFIYEIHEITEPNEKKLKNTEVVPHNLQEEKIKFRQAEIKTNRKVTVKKQTDK